jgi:hypothetical protein
MLVRNIRRHTKAGLVVSNNLLGLSQLWSAPATFKPINANHFSTKESTMDIAHRKEGEKVLAVADQWDTIFTLKAINMSDDDDDDEKDNE